MRKLSSRIVVAVTLLAVCSLCVSAQMRPEVDAQNKKITEDNATVARTFKAGNEALAANRLEEAIAAYREGLAIRPDEPAVLANLSEALRRRGSNTYDETLKNAEALANGRRDAAAKDWLEAAEASQKALRIINRAGSDPQQQGEFAQTRLAANYTRALAMRLVATKVDQTRANEAWDAYQKLIGVEPDPAKKSRLKTDALQLLYEAGELDMAIAQARISLAQEPGNVDANRILGMSLASSGDPSKYAEAVKYLEIYLAKALDSDPLKQPAKDVLGFVKTQVPAATRTGRNRKKG